MISGESAKGRAPNTNGSHHYLKHPARPKLRVTIAIHNKDLKRKTLATIIEQAGYSPELALTT